MDEQRGCRECGAAPWRGLDCRGQWDELLALEFSDPRAGRVHFETVACYQLQHPGAFALTAAARRQLRDGLADRVVHGRPVEEVRARMGAAFAGASRVRARTRDEAVDTHAPRTWSRTVADVLPPDAGAHAERVHAWALAVLDELDAAELRGDR